MDFLTNPHFWASWARIVVIDLLLAGDNALVIALAVRKLPPREQLWGRIFGTIGAVLLRLLFIAIVTFLLAVPLLRLIGGLLLIWIAVKLVREHCAGPEDIRPGTTLRAAIGVIILADVVMSLDNVIAIAAAAHGDLVLVAFGLLLSLPLVVWGSGVLSQMMNRFPVIVWIGGGVLGWVAMKMLTDDPFVVKLLGEWRWPVHHNAPHVLAVFIALLGWWGSRSAAKVKPAP
jgi:YjbE family integral membrane protein